VKAIGCYTPQPITSPDALVDIELPTPRPGPSDLLVAVNAVSVNPVDVKSRASAAPPKGEARILGFDAAGVVMEVGREVRLFKPGDEVSGYPQIEYVASLTATDKHLPGIAEAIAPQGRLALIDDPEVLDIVKLKRKSISVHWELMFTRCLFQTPDMIAQHRSERAKRNGNHSWKMGARSYIVRGKGLLQLQS
jgi:hypothetical protein